MGFLNIPLKTIGAFSTEINSVQTMPWDNPNMYPVAPGAPAPSAVPRDFTWSVRFDIVPQQHSAAQSRAPGKYTGMDVTVGQWVANSVTGQAWQIIEVSEKSDSAVKVTLQDVYRYNTFRDTTGSGVGAPSLGNYIIFNISDAGLPQIDPVPVFGISAHFTQNLSSRFEYINTQYDYPLYQEGNTFSVGDVIAADSVTNQFVLADGVHRVVIGRITSLSDTKPGWFTINPVQKIVDFLDWLPGNVGDIIYSDGTALSTTGIGPQIYVKLRDNTRTVVNGKSVMPPEFGSVLQVNGVNVEFTGVSAESAAADINAVSSQTGITAEVVAAAQYIDVGIVTNIYGEPALYAVSNPATAKINGVLVTFDIASTEPGYAEYSRATQIAQAINRANIPNVTAVTSSTITLRIINEAGSGIVITDQTSDPNGVFFAGPNSATGFPVNTPASTAEILRLTAVDSRPINLLDVVGTPTVTAGLVSVENGVKAAGMYIKEGLRNSNATVVANLQQLYALQPIAGDSAFVIDSADAEGNNQSEWSMWLYDGAAWVRTSTQDSATTDAKSLEETFAHDSVPDIIVGHISTGRRITLITVEVFEAFDGNATLSIGYDIHNITNPVSTLDGLMMPEIIDLTVPGIYTCSSSVLFGVDTPEGDVTVTASYNRGGATGGAAQIIVSYV